VDLATAAERVWYGRSGGAAAVRLALAPLAGLFRIGALARGALYDIGAFEAHHLGLPALGVGNLTVGGTGKTPVAAWACGELARRGARPALLMRGVGGDEARVHALLNPAVPVVADPDRVRGAARAVALGADCLVLDDAFQHRRARRDADLVLVSAERFAADAVRSLPAGPYREPLGALGRAAVVVVTRKSASPAEGARAADVLARRVPGGASAVVHLAAAELRAWHPEGGAGAVGRLPSDLRVLRGATVLAPAGVGDPGAFAAQLAAAGAHVDLVRFPDHHAYGDRDVRTLMARAEAAAARSRGAVRVVTTLKDAVKLGPRWPRGGWPLWYVSQRVTVERGAALLAEQLDAIAQAARARAAARVNPAHRRRAATPRAGPSRPAWPPTSARSPRERSRRRS
jgi:tetraacyldisaccharide 4'-kinase